MLAHSNIPLPQIPAIRPSNLSPTTYCQSRDSSFPPTTLLSIAGSAIAEEAITGGSQAAAGEFPYQVSVQTSSHKCGESIIDNDHIPTAAHCVDGLSADRLRIRAGSNRHDSGGKLVKVAKVTQHSEFDAKTIKNDIAVLKLASSLDFETAIPAVKFSSSADDTPQVGARCSVTGWEVLLLEEALSPRTSWLRTSTLVDHEKCAEEYVNRHEVMTP